MTARQVPTAVRRVLPFVLLLAVQPVPVGARQSEPSQNNLVAWFDAAHTESLFADLDGDLPAGQGDGVALWRSRIGDHAFVQEDEAVRPLLVDLDKGPGGVLELPRSQAFMTADSLAPTTAAKSWTMFVVVAIDEASTGGSDILQGRGLNDMRGFSVKNRCRRCVHFDYSDKEEIHTEHRLDAGWNLLEAVIEQRIVTLWVNGLLEVTSEAPFGTAGDRHLEEGTLVLGGITGKRYGIRASMDGKIAEILLFETALDEEAQQQSRDYLMAKWGIVER